MRILWFLVRVLIILCIFGLVGYGMAQFMISHAVARGTPEYEVRLAAYTGGLFAGGSVAAIFALLLVVLDRRSGRRRRDGMLP